MDARNFQFMFYGFSAVFLLLTCYVAYLVGRGRKIRSEIENLRKMVEEKEKK
jgi:CcmD family protein